MRFRLPCPQSKYLAFLLFFLAASAGAASPEAPAAGTASGSLTVDGKKVALHHAYAMVQPHWMGGKLTDVAVLLTAEPLTPAALAVGELRDAMPSGPALLVHLEEDGSPGLEVVRHPALGEREAVTKQVEVEFRPGAVGSGEVAGSFATAAAPELDGHPHQIQVTFRAAIANPAPLPPAGAAVGAVTVDGKAVALQYAYAMAQQDRFDRKASLVAVLLTAEPLGPGALTGALELREAMPRGPCLLVVVGSHGEALELELVRHPAFGAEEAGTTEPLSKFRAGPATSGEVSGRLSTFGARDLEGRRYQVRVAFRAALRKPELAAPPPVGQAEGRIVVDGQEVALRHAYAMPQRSLDGRRAQLALLLAEQPIPEADFEDASELRLAWKAGAGLLLVVDPDGSSALELVRHPVLGADTLGAGSRSRFRAAPEVKGEAAGLVSTGGTEEYAGHQYLSRASFRAALRHPEPLPAAGSGDRLPAGGGEPGAAYLAFHRAVRKADLAVVRAWSPRGPSISDEHLKEACKAMAAMTPPEPKVERAYQRGGLAALYLVGRVGGKQMYGTVRLRLRDGVWTGSESWSASPWSK